MNTGNMRFFRRREAGGQILVKERNGNIYTLSTNKKLDTFGFALFVEYLQKYSKYYSETLGV